MFYNVLQYWSADNWSNHWSIASKRHDTRFTTCATGADASVHSAVLLVVLPVPWLTDVSSSQQWVIYSQTNGAVSNYTYLFRFVWFVVVFFWLVIMFSGLLLCFLNCYFVFLFAFAFVICYFVFWIVICFCTSRPPYISDWCESHVLKYIFKAAHGN